MTLANSPISVIQPPEPSLVVDDEQKDFTDFKHLKQVFDKIKGDFETEVEYVKRNRDLRYFRNVATDILQQNGIIKADELYCKVHTIDTNIRREQPQYLLYITQSRRAAVFVGPDGSAMPGSELVENDFTAKARYTGWEVPFIRVVDGCQLHGYDVVEVVFDETKPGHFSIEHVGRENLIFYAESENIQAQEIIGRRLSLTGWQIEEEVRSGLFDKEQARILLNSAQKKEVCKEQNKFEVFKVFYRHQKQIFYCYYAEHCTDFLSISKPYFNGVMNVVDGKTVFKGQNLDGTPILDYNNEVEADYPFFILRYVESEDPQITSLCGRSKLDESAQEAASAILSGFTNGVLRASNIYASPASNNINRSPDAAPKQTDVVLKNGAIYDQAMNFFHTSYPDQSALAGLQTVVSLNEQEQSQINYTVLNRKDSEKTATEINAAKEENTRLSSVQVTLLSIFMRQLYSYCWRMYQSRVLSGRIIIPFQNLQLFGEIQRDPVTGEMLVVGIRNYQLRASGDVDVIKRAEKLQKQMQAWPVIAQTPIAMSFFKDLLRNAFPEEAEKYILELEQTQIAGDQQKNMLIAKLAALLKELGTDEEGNLNPELQGMETQIQQLQQEVQTALSAQAPMGPRQMQQNQQMPINV